MGKLLKTIRKRRQLRLEIRMNEKEKNRVLKKALLYTDGNLSEFIRYAAIHFTPDKDDLH